MATELSNLPSDPSIPSNSSPQVPQNIKMETTAYRNDMDTKPSVPPVADPKQMTETDMKIMYQHSMTGKLF